MFDNRFYLMWEFYLLASKYSFINMGNVVFQIQIAKNIETIYLLQEIICIIDLIYMYQIIILNTYTKLIHIFMQESLNQYLLRVGIFLALVFIIVVLIYPVLQNCFFI